METVGERIKKMRVENNWTQKDLATKLGLSNDTAIANYESNYSIPKDGIKYKLCEIFNCSMDYLMGISEIRNPKELEKVQFANSNGLDVNGLEEEDLLEIQKQIDYIKKLKGNK